ncbi:uncharacterized protein P174DRAFT_282864 [Aspergillus novofumigatus IBT 16806]|uniref:Secreted protein n=1 Tax=Aspergillus novofumigatus (strain IBT 16806) TaxID=1392255 RepID=A0A2I1C0D0_ASPN1|nr:uncharacterized protein P174DRAFT_282864 [Aspergillus novofumigatus IBT 16806]PKX91055.1 hypothetical protein P174DRAFT_282864 [Aspergillus novofumigatus IBT 16806]
MFLFGCVGVYLVLLCRASGLGMAFYEHSRHLHLHRHNRTECVCRAIDRNLPFLFCIRGCVSTFLVLRGILLHLIVDVTERRRPSSYDYYDTMYMTLCYHLDVSAYLVFDLDSRAAIAGGHSSVFSAFLLQAPFQLEVA